LANQRTPTTVTLAPIGQQPQGSADMIYDLGKKTLTVTTKASGLAPGSSHAQHIHLGSCAAQGEVKYGLDDLVASPTGTAEKTTVVPNAEAPPASGWYLNVNLGSSGQIEQNGQPTLYFQPIICANIGK
jgi:CHRD domain